MNIDGKTYESSRAAWRALAQGHMSLTTFRRRTVGYTEDEDIALSAIMAPVRMGRPRKAKKRRSNRGEGVVICKARYSSLREAHTELVVRQGNTHPSYDTFRRRYLAGRDLHQLTEPLRLKRSDAGEARGPQENPRR